MHEFPPNIDPKLVTLTAVLLGYALLDDFTAAEQLAIGNWFITIGQTMVCNGTYQIVLEERIRGNIININSKQFKSGGSPFENPPKPNFENIKNNFEEMFQNEQIEILKNAIDKLNIELEKLKKE